MEEDRVNMKGNSYRKDNKGEGHIAGKNMEGNKERRGSLFPLLT